MNWEHHVLLWFLAHRTPGLNRFFLLSRWLGETWVLTAIVLATALAEWVQGRRRAALVWVVAGMVGLFVGWAIKRGVARPRPHLGPWLVFPHDFSFPSGHALGTSLVYPLLAWRLSARYPAARAWFWLAAILIVVWVGIGRLYLGVHWPTDVLGGWAIGAFIAWRATYAFRARGASN